MSSPQLRSILLVDDDEISNLFNSIFIGKLYLDIEVHVVRNGAEALDFLNHRGNGFPRPALLLLDTRMPVLDGWEFLEAFTVLDKEIKKGLSIVVLTTSHKERERAKGMKDPNIKAILQKPLSEKKLSQLIKKLFHHSKTCK